MSPFREMEVEGQLEEVVDQGRKEESGEQAKVGDIVEAKVGDIVEAREAKRERVRKAKSA